jgi:signal transduction histidine kinase
MKNITSAKSIILPICSLLLLGGFLAFYLYSNYKEAKALTTNKVTLLFENAYVNTENKNFTSVIEVLKIKAQKAKDSLGQVQANNDDLTSASIIREKHEFQSKETIKEPPSVVLSNTTVTKSISNVLEGINKDSLLLKKVKGIKDSVSGTKIFIRKGKDLNIDSVFKEIGSLSGIAIRVDTTKRTSSTHADKKLSLNLSSKSQFKTSKSVSMTFDWGKDITQLVSTPVLDSVIILFDKSLKSDKLPIKYKVLPESKMSDKSSVKTFADENKYGVSLDNQPLYFLKQIGQEILISSVLFLAILFTFYNLFKTSLDQRRLFEEKQDFLRNMTHELKTPISTIGIALEAVKNFHSAEAKEKQQEYFKLAEEENKRLNLLVDKVLNFSKDAKGQVQKVDVSSLIKSTIDPFVFKANQKNILLDINSPEGLHLNTDQNALQFIISNLLENALKYTISPSPKISISTSKQKNMLNIDVVDNGTPIAPEYREKIFEKYFRIPTGHVHQANGHGIGLYVVRQLAEELGGSVNLQVTENGNSFSVKIPDLKL